MAFGTLDKPFLEAKDLVNKMPFAKMNASEDVFNFLNNPEFVDWFKTLGIKYLILSGDSRNIYPSEKDVENWESIKGLVEKTPGLKRVDWGISFPVYEIPDILPRSFAVEKLIAVVGPDLLIVNHQLPATIYFEDGKWDPMLLNGKNKDSIKLLFNGKDKTDLTMSFLQKYFISASESASSQWVKFSSGEYLKYKYELLIRGFVINDFDYGKGVAFSTEKDETIKFLFRVPKSGSYILVKRSGDGQKQNLSWVMEEKNLKKGTFKYEIINKLGFEILNVVALIPKEEYVKAEGIAETYISYFGLMKENEIKDPDWQEVKLVKEGTLKYGLKTPEKGFWLIFSDNYHSLWKFRRWINYSDSVPVYSMVNGFYFEPKWNDLHIEFRGQTYFRWGVWAGGITFLSLLIIYLWFYSNKNERKNKRDIIN